MFRQHFEGAGKEDGRRGGTTNLRDYCYIVSPFHTQRLAVRIIFLLYTLARVIPLISSGSLYYNTHILTRTMLSVVF